MTTQTINKESEKLTVVRVNTCLPRQVWNDLVVTLKRPYSRAEEGKLDKGDLATWILDAALSTIANKSYLVAMERFVEEKQLKEEFETYFKDSFKSPLQ